MDSSELEYQNNSSDFLAPNEYRNFNASTPGSIQESEDNKNFYANLTYLLQEDQINLINNEDLPNFLASKIEALPKKNATSIKSLVQDIGINKIQSAIYHKRHWRLMNTNLMKLIEEKREFKYLCKIPKSYIADEFNLTGLNQQIQNFSTLHKLLLGNYHLSNFSNKSLKKLSGLNSSTLKRKRMNQQAMENEDDSDSDSDHEYDEAEPEIKLYHLEMILHRAFTAYGAIHARYVITKDGLDQIAEKYDSKTYGPCPRYYCSEVQLLPCGVDDFPNHHICKLYCPSCLDLYEISPNLMPILDGSFFGRSFIGIFLNAFTELDKYVAKKKMGIISESLRQKENILKANENHFIAYDDVMFGKPGLKHTLQNFQYEPKVFGFRINQNSEVGPKMKWLRHWPVSDVQKREFELCEKGIPELNQAEEEIRNKNNDDDNIDIVEEHDNL